MIKVLDGAGSVELIDHMGNDLTVVNSARVSFDKWHEEFDHDKDSRLINYLARNGHWTPFSQVQFQFRIKMPIFVARQWFKHQVGFTRNEVSRRYVDDNLEFYVPEHWRLRHDSAKQGSSDETITHTTSNTPIKESLTNVTNMMQAIYEQLIEEGIAPEMARMILPQSMFTTFIETASLAAYARLCKQRMDPHAQWETQMYALAVSEAIEAVCPESWSALVPVDNSETS